MKNSYLPLTTTLTILAAVLVHGVQDDQAKVKEHDELASRVELLETRTELLEQILFSSVKLETNRAQRALDDRKEQLKNSKQLFAKGLLNQFQLQQDQLLVQTATRELELAKAPSNQRHLICEIEFIEAKRKLQIATEELKYRRNMARRGYVSSTEVQTVARWVDEATQVLDQAKIKLEAAKKFDELKNLATEKQDLKQPAETPKSK